MAITASAAGGSWSATGAWVGGVVPTASDDVLITTASGNITVDGTSGSPSLCRSLDCTTFTGTLTQAASKVLTIGDASGGKLTLVSGMTYVPNASSTINFVSTTGTNNITTAGKAMSQMVFNGAGGTWQFQDGFTSTSNGKITLTAGTLDLNGFTFSIASLADSGTATRALTLGAAQLTFSAAGVFWNLTSTGMTFTGGTSKITANTNGATFTGGGLTYNNLVATGGITINGANTFANFTMNTVAGVTPVVKFAANQTITNTFTSSGGSATLRAIYQSSTIGTPITLTVATNAITWADFMDITAGGAANWDLHAITGGAGDCGGNTGITFTVGANQYYQTAVSANYNNTAKWFLATNGGGGAGRVPLPQDTAIFDANSITSGSLTITMSQTRFGGLNLTGITNTPTFNFSTSGTFFGDVTLVVGITYSGTSALSFSNHTSQNYTSAGLTITNPLTINSGTGTVTFADALITNNTITQTSGNSASSNTISCTSFTVSSGTFTLGGDVTLTSTLSVTSGTLTGAFNISGGTTCTGAGTISISGFSGTTATTSAGGNWTFTTLSLSGAFTSSSNSGNLTIGSGGMTCTTFSWGGTGGSGTFTSGSGLINCSSTATWGGNGASTITLGSGGFMSTTLTISSGASIPTVNFGTGTITCSGTGTVFTGAAVTINANTATLAITDTSVTTKTISMGAINYQGMNVSVSGAASNGTVTISGACTVNNWIFAADASIIWTKTTTYTFSGLTCNGSSGHIVTFATNTAGTAATLSCANLISVDWMSIKDSTASNNIPFYAGLNSTSVSGNTNWKFNLPPPGWWPVYSTNASVVPPVQQWANFQTQPLPDEVPTFTTRWLQSKTLDAPPVTPASIPNFFSPIPDITFSSVWLNLPAFNAPPITPPDKPNYFAPNWPLNFTDRWLQSKTLDAPPVTPASIPNFFSPIFPAVFTILSWLPTRVSDAPPITPASMPNFFPATFIPKVTLPWLPTRVSDAPPVIPPDKPNFFIPHQGITFVSKWLQCKITDAPPITPADKPNYFAPKWPLNFIDRWLQSKTLDAPPITPAYRPNYFAPKWPLNFIDRWLQSKTLDAPPITPASKPNFFFPKVFEAVVLQAPWFPARVIDAPPIAPAYRQTFFSPVFFEMYEAGNWSPAHKYPFTGSIRQVAPTLQEFRNAPASLGQIRQTKPMLKLLRKDPPTLT